MSVIIITILSVLLVVSESLPFLKRLKINGLLEAVIEQLRKENNTT